MKQDLNRAGRPKPLRRTAARSFSLATDWRRAIYHHRRLVSDPMSATKRHALRRTAWCCIRTATATRPVFTTCMGFFRTIPEGSRDADRRSAGEARLMFITRASAISALMLASRTSFDGHSTQLKSTASPSFFCTERWKSVTLPPSSPQFSTSASRRGP